MISLKNSYISIFLGSLLAGACIDAAPPVKRHISPKIQAAQRKRWKPKAAPKPHPRLRLSGPSGSANYAGLTPKPAQKPAPQKVQPKRAPRKPAPKTTPKKVLTPSEQALLARARDLATRIKNDSKNKSLLLPTFGCSQAEVVNGGHACAYVSSQGPAKITFGSMIKDLSRAQQIQTILHELAHAYDPILTKNASHNGAIGFNHYPHLKNAPKNFRFQAKAMIASEWHAEWQSIQWMKKYTPELVPELIAELGIQVMFGMERPLVPQYPPNAVLLQWLS